MTIYLEDTALYRMHLFNICFTSYYINQIDHKGNAMQANWKLVAIRNNDSSNITTLKHHVHCNWQLQNSKLKLSLLSFM